MQIKIGDKIFDGEHEPIMVILTPTDKENISNMDPHAFKYCVVPDSMSIDDAKEFMKTE